MRRHAVLIVRAIRMHGPKSVYCSNLGSGARRQGSWTRDWCYRQAFAGRPGYAQTYATSALPDVSGQARQAAEAFARQRAPAPGAAETHSTWGIRCMRRAV